MIWLVNRGSWLKNIAQVNNIRLGSISPYASAPIVPPVRHDLAVYSHPTQALLCSPQPRPNRGLDMVDRYEVIPLTFVLYFGFAYISLSTVCQTPIAIHLITLGTVYAIDLCTHAEWMAKGSHGTGQKSRHWRSYRKIFATTSADKHIILCSMIHPVGYDFESGGHLVRAYSVLGKRWSLGLCRWNPYDAKGCIIKVVTTLFNIDQTPSPSSSSPARSSILACCVISDQHK